MVLSPLLRGLSPRTERRRCFRACACCVASELSGSIPMQADVQELVENLGSGDRSVRCGAVMELGRIGPRATGAVPALIKMLKDARSVRFHAVKALGHIGPAS